jgi:Holliday junction resolvase RusA-like endonuclease
MRDFRHRIYEISKWRRRIGAYATPGKKFQKAHIVCERHSLRESDYDNLVGCFKSVIDALVWHGILLDDNPKLLIREYKWIKAKKGQYKIVLRITSELKVSSPGETIP